MNESIRALREGAGLTQVELADRIGVHPNTVSSWERGATEPIGSQIVALAKTLGVSVEAVMGLPEAASA